MDASVNRIPSSKDERAILIALRMNGEDVTHVRYSLDELKMLVKTAGAFVIESRIVNREKIDPAYVIGKGFVETLRAILAEQKIRLIVFDINNIRPAQVRNLEEALKCRVVGRTEVILDIFARRARSAEAKLQVELAQLRYILPRLKGLGGVLSRLGGGIGTRGPGETMLETDRRHIMRRISRLKEKLERVHEHRSLTRQSRKSMRLGAVVGYTNAGKSTLINLLARDDLFVEDRLFATLDAFTRRVYLDDKNQVLLTDTVGFIRNLPANLIESFRTTLDEIVFADFLIHVVDIGSPDIEMNIETVRKELSTLECQEKKTILFFNKSDSVTPEIENLVITRFPEAITGSVIKGTNIELLKAKISSILS